MFDRVFDAIGPTDFIEEIWVRDLVDVTWGMLRWRRVLAALLRGEVWEETNNEATSLVEDQAQVMEGSEKEEMDRLLDPLLTWEERVAKYPDENKKFQELCSAAKSTLNMDLIQARVLRDNLNTIERFENLITIAQRRIAEVIHELDRHRFVQKQLNSSHDREGIKFGAVEPKMIEGKAINKKVA